MFLSLVKTVFQLLCFNFKVQTKTFFSETEAADESLTPFYDEPTDTQSCRQEFQCSTSVLAVSGKTLSFGTGSACECVCACAPSPGGVILHSYDDAGLEFL